ncbi:MAG: ATP-binding protein [Armatimonadota bacterium]
MAGAPPTGYFDVYDTLVQRLNEPAPGRIQLVTGPRQVGKTTLLSQLAKIWGDQAFYCTADAPEAALSGWWESQWQEAYRLARQGTAVMLIDEIQYLPNWSRLLKYQIDQVYRERIPLQVVVTGSSSLKLGAGARETMAGRFEHLLLTHWPARDLARAFGLSTEEAVSTIVRFGSFPGAISYRDDLIRWRTYVRDSIIDPAIGRDLFQLELVRKPALLRQVFAICAGHPAEVLSLNKIAGELNETGAIQTIAHYLELLNEAYLVTAVRRYAKNEIRKRAAPSKIVPLSNAFLAARIADEPPTKESDPVQWGRWVENACLAHAINCQQALNYWREEPYEVDGIIEGTWGRWAVEIKTGAYSLRDLQGLLEFTRRNPEFRPLLIGDADYLDSARRAGIATVAWEQFLWDGVTGI